METLLVSLFFQHFFKVNGQAAHDAPTMVRSRAQKNCVMKFFFLFHSWIFHSVWEENWITPEWEREREGGRRSRTRYTHRRVVVSTCFFFCSKKFAHVLMFAKSELWVLVLINERDPIRIQPTDSRRVGLDHCSTSRLSQKRFCVRKKTKKFPRLPLFVVIILYCARLSLGPVDILTSQYT